MSKKTLWLDRELVTSPYHYRVCVREKDFYAELKRLSVPEKHWPEFTSSPHADATAHFLTHAKTGNRCAIVCLSKIMAKRHAKTTIYGLLVHEAVHIWQHIKEDIGEFSPSSEFEAYSIQRIAQSLMWSWRKQAK